MWDYLINTAKIKKKLNWTDLFSLMDSEILRKRLREKITERGWTVNFIEKKHGPALRYFLSGRTKNPKIDQLIKFCKILDINLFELDLSSESLYRTSSKDSFSPQIFYKIVDELKEFLRKNPKELSISQVFSALNELYVFCCKKKLEKIDSDLAEIFFIKTFSKEKLID